MYDARFQEFWIFIFSLENKRLDNLRDKWSFKTGDCVILHLDSET